jgi:NodT family efflux transporter outer membrane factor (OMF) lipoprotein
MKTITLALIGLTLAGCAAVGPDFKAPQTAAPDAIGAWHGGAAALRGTGLPENAPAPFARFPDSVLAELQRRAFEANHDLRTAMLRFAESRLQRNIAASGEGPQANAKAAAQRERQSEAGAATRMLGIVAPPGKSDALAKALAEPFSVYQAGFDASWELDLWGRVKRSVEAADANVEEATAALRQVQLGVSVEVARTYYEMRAAQRQQQLANADIAATAQLLDLAAARRAGGLATEIDVVRQKSQLAAQRAALPALLEQEAQAMNQLSLLTGAAPGALQVQLAALPGAADAPFGSTPDLALGIASDLVARRPDIEMAQASLHAATAGVGIAMADLYPRIALGAAFGSEALGAGRFGDWGSRQWSVGPSLSLPLFDQGRRRATVELRELQQQEAAVRYQKTVLGAWSEVDNALSAYAAERMRRAQWQEREVAGQVALELANVRFRQGMTDYLPVLDAQRALFQAQRERVQSEAALTLRLLAICKAAGMVPQS